MPSKKTALLFISLLWLSHWVSAAPDPFYAEYDVKKGGLVLGENTTRLVYSGNRYTYLKQTKANGLAALLSNDKLTERSSGIKQGENLLPQAYLRHHKNRRKDRRDQFQFNNRTQVTGHYKDESYQLKVPPNTLDPAVLDLYIMEAVATRQPLRYHITEKGELKEYHFQHRGREKIALPAGEYLCEKIHMVRDEGNRATTIWLAPELNYLPVKIRHNEKGDILESELTRYQPAG